MDSEQVTRRQARIIQSRVEPFRTYLHELRQRMVNRGFGPGDPLLEIVKAAQRSICEMYYGEERAVRTRFIAKHIAITATAAVEGSGTFVAFTAEPLLMVRV